MRFLKHILFAIFITISVPASFVYAQAGGGPVFTDANVTFGPSTNGNYAANVFGSFTLPNNVPIADIALFIVILDQAVNPVSSYAGNFNTLLFGDGNNIEQVGQDYIFNIDLFDVDGSTPFTPSEDYQFIFKIASQSDPALFQPVYNSTNATVPADAQINNNGYTATTTSDGQPDLNPATITFNSTIHNPLGADLDLLDFLRRLFATMVKISLPFLVIFMIYSGFLFVQAQGNVDELAKAKKNFLYVIIGACLVFGAWLIATVLKGTVDQIEAPISLVEKIISIIV